MKKTKKCSKCGKRKKIERFVKNTRSNDGYRTDCKECHNLYHARRKSNPEYMARRSENTKKWKKGNPERVKEIKSASDKRCRPHIRAYMQQKRDTDIQYRLALRLRIRLWHALKGKTKGGSAVRDLGCTIPQLMKQLESKFKPGMTWDNYGKWHIDHIKPLIKFDLTDRLQLKIACHHSNLQPLWGEDNLSKGAERLVA